MSKAKRSAAPMPAGLTFDRLVLSIRGIDAELAAQAGRSVKISLTLRNWLIGCYIAEYELRGADRAQNGEKLLANLSVRLAVSGVSRAEERELRRYRQFYQSYSQIGESLTPELRKHLATSEIGQSGTVRQSLNPESGIPGKELVTKPSFSRIAELVVIHDTRNRSFIENDRFATVGSGRDEGLKQMDFHS
jgi:hypothetical protein